MKGTNMKDAWSRRRLRAAALTIAMPAVIGSSVVLAAVTANASAATRKPALGPVAPLAAPALKAATNTPAGRQAERAYWTPARMAAAKPATGATSSSGAAVNAGDTATGPSGTAGGYDPSGLAGVLSAASPINRDLNSTSVSPADGGYPGPNDTFTFFGTTTAYPVSTVGKLFFTEPSGNFVCSATATYGSSAQPSMVWTAGHCVGPQGGESYYSNWLFCPQYNNGAEPVGCWTWANAQQTGGWYFDGYWSADYAYLYMAPQGKGQKTLSSVTGGLGFAWNQSRDQIWQDMGYPSASPYSGGKLVETSAEHRYDVTNPNGTAGADTGPQDVSIGSSQTPGFSGGPWILSFGKNESGDPLSHANWINGNNSYYFTSGGPGGGNEYGIEIQSPYYDTNACNFWKGGSGYTGTC
jgi:V8-like Glu-specific endopeptidase